MLLLLLRAVAAGFWSPVGGGSLQPCWERLGGALGELAECVPAGRRALLCAPARRGGPSYPDVRSSGLNGGGGEATRAAITRETETAPSCHPSACGAPPPRQEHPRRARGSRSGPRATSGHRGHSPRPERPRHLTSIASFNRNPYVHIHQTPPPPCSRGIHILRWTKSFGGSPDPFLSPARMRDHTSQSPSSGETRIQVLQSRTFSKKMIPSERSKCCVHFSTLSRES